MVYLLQMVMFHGKLLNNQMVNGFYHGYHPPYLDRTEPQLWLYIQLRAELNPNELREFSLKYCFLHSTFDYFSLWLQEF